MVRHEARLVGYVGYAGFNGSPIKIRRPTPHSSVIVKGILHIDRTQVIKEAYSKEMLK